ncbi:MAG: ABC transporter permease subunit [Flavobacteriaceae bacterium]|jgi:ABC-type transport system involved in multi-copper enzyme maturation permease subunit
MKRLLLIEYHKMIANRSSRMLIIAYFVLLSLIASIAAIKFDIGPIEFHLAEQGIFNFPFIWHFNSFIAALFKIFLAVVIVSMVANEYSYKTIKQNLIDGLSKYELLKSKVLMVVALSLSSTVFIFILSLILGYRFSDYNEIGIVFRDLEYLLAYFIKLFGFFSFCLFLGILIKRSAFALGFLAVWQMAEGISFGLMKWKLSDVVSYVSAEQVFAFFPLNSMSELIPQPFNRLSAVKNIAGQIGEQLDANIGVSWSNVAIVLLWTGVFLWMSYRILQQRDL